MSEIEIDIRFHCIETAVKRSYNRLLYEYLRNKGGDVESEKKLDLLQKALTDFDFPSLRAAHKELAGKSGARVILTDTEGNLPGIIINGILIDM